MNAERSVEFALSPRVTAIERPRLCVSGPTAIMSSVLGAALTINDCIKKKCRVPAMPAQWFLHLQHYQNKIKKNL